MKTLIFVTMIALTLGACADGRAVPIVAAGVVGAVVGAEIVSHNRHHRHCYYSQYQQRRVCHWR
ncbi:MAG: hypothetical protein P4L82_15095 [Ancalomicrobiaceae bacterium]|nr:hypothetical protein [Ancalomicrobiaceae bacterium]